MRELLLRLVVLVITELLKRSSTLDSLVEQKRSGGPSQNA